MAAEASIEQRLAALEKAVADIQLRLAGLPAGANWLEQFIGSFKDEPAFDEVIEYGRAFRAADRPPEDPGA